MTIDPITLEIIGNRLDAVCKMMEFRLFHSAYSTILRESHDGSAGIAGPDGEIVACSGAPLHIATYGRSVKALISTRGDTMRPGDAYLITDPYFGGNLHVPDLVAVEPVFVDGRRLCFMTSSAHKPDLGGIVPGSSGAAAREIFHDGLLLRGTRYATADGVDQEVEGLIRSNSRAPDAAIGDIRSQAGCCRYGAELVSVLCAEYGIDTLLPGLSEILATSELQVRQALRAWPDGEHSAEAFLDDDGVNLGERLPIRVRARKEGDSLTVDVTGSAGAVVGPINLRPQAVETAVALATVTMSDPTIRINAGILRPIEIVNPAGQITHAQWPSPVNSYFGNTLVVYSTLLKALSEFNGNRAVGSVGLGQGAFAIGYQGSADRERTVQYEVMGSSLGGTPQFDGTNVVQGMQHNTPNTPVEVLETEYPVRVLRHEWIVDSCGAGQFRGGPGYIKEYEVLADAVLTLRLGHSFGNGGWGVRGGQPGRNTRAVLIQRDQQRELRPLETIPLHAGDRLRIHMAGGGGYGDPRLRDCDAVVEDVRNGYVSARAAVDVYGLDPDQLPPDGTPLPATLRRGAGR